MPALSIRAFLTLVIGSIGAILVIFAGSSMIEDLARSEKAQRIVALTEISQNLLPAFISGRIERGTQIPALLRVTPADDAAWQRLAINRAITDARLEASLIALRQSHLDDAARLAAQLADSHDKFVKFRAIVDAAIRLPLAARDPQLLAQYRQVAGQYIDAMVTATDQTEAALKLFDPQIDQLLAIKRAAWATRSFSGLVAIQAENATAQERAWTPEEIVTVAENHGRADLAWNLVNEATARPEIPAGLRDAVAAANADAKSPKAMQQKGIFDDLSHGRKATLPVAALQALNTELLSNVVQVLERAMSAIVAQAGSYQTAARWHLVASGGILATVILLTGLGIFVVHYRVGAPIRRITELMRRLAELDTNIEIDITGRRDEIGEMTRALLVFRRAIEDRSRRQKEREMQRFLETMIDAMPVSISFKDLELRYLYVNLMRRRLLHEEGDLVGKRLRDIAAPAHAAVVEEIDQRVLATGETEHFEQVWAGADGNPVILWSLKTPFRDQDGVIRGVITCGVDITRLKETEAELIIQRETAETANRGKSAFLANMSHELRTPLNAIIGFAEVMASGYLGHLGDQQQDYVINIRKAGEHLLHVVNDLLDLSRLETSQSDLQVVSCPFDSIAATALGMVRVEADKLGTHMSFTPTNLQVQADERALTQVLVNLLANAVKFSGRNGKVTLRAAPSAAGIRIEIEDNGIGMSDAQREAALTAVMPADPYRARPGGGAGLGFAICRRLIELHHGSLEIASQAGAGSVVSIMLPAA